MKSDDFQHLVGSIYDCAANPELWPGTLELIRDRFDAAYVLVGLADTLPAAPAGTPQATFRSSPWDAIWFEKLFGMLHLIPGGGSMMRAGIDSSWTQFSEITLEDFHQSVFYNMWVKPQDLGDCLNTPFMQRRSLLGVMSIAGKASRSGFGQEERNLAEALSPHIRRAMAINDIVDKGRLALALYRKVLDNLSVAVFVVGSGRRLAFTNSAGDALLSEGSFLRLQAGMLAARRVAGANTALDDAIERAAKGDHSIGIAGIGVPLFGNDGERAAAYVLPITGNDLRGALGDGYAAVFIAKRGEQQPMAVEILRTVFDLTQSEARVGVLVANGDAPAAIAESLGVSINTVRSHLARAFGKTDTSDQTALAALINGLLPPVLSAQ
jgi:DNA-binding CsgD family transcriptional regulator